MEPDGPRLLSNRFFDAFYRGEECLPDHAGTRMRTVQVIVENENRRMTRVVGTFYVIVDVDRRGRIDQRAQREEGHLAINSLAVPEAIRQATTVVRAERQFA